MSLSEFPHLIICFMAAAALAVYAKRHMAELTRTSSRQTHCERIVLAGVAISSMLTIAARAKAYGRHEDDDEYEDSLEEMFRLSTKRREAFDKK